MPAFLRRFCLDKQTVVFFLTLGLLAVSGIWLLLYSTPEGLGLNDDSIAYIAGARSLISGDGYRAAWLISNKPMTHFPPGFPGALALIGLVTGLDPLRGARLLNGLLFGFSITLTGVLGWRMTKSKLFGVVAASLFLLTDSLLLIHSDAMSEPLYVFLTLAALILLDLYFERDQAVWLVALGCVLGLAYLARYAALSLFATLIIVLFLLQSTWRKRLMSAVVLAVSSLPWPIAWSIRNRIVGGSFTNRVLGWHPITNDNSKLGMRMFADFLIPARKWRIAVMQTPGLIEGIVIVLALGMLIWLLNTGLRRFFRPEQVKQPEIISFSNALYVFGYLSVLISTMTLFDPATRFQIRILSPIYPSFLLLFVAAISWIWWQSQVAWKLLVVLLTILVMGTSVYSEVQTVRFLHRGGQVYASWRWRESEAIAFLRELPSDVIIHTNQPGVVYLYTGRPCTIFPYESGIDAVKQNVLAGKAVFAFFRDFGAGVGSLKNYQILTEGLYVHIFSGDEVYTAPPP